MHNHNNTDNGHDNHKHMMWMMLICCALPLVILLFGGGALFSDGYLTKVLIGAFAVACIWMMFKRHGNPEENSATNVAEKLEKDTGNKHDNCCH